MITIICSTQYPLGNFKQLITKASGLGKNIEFLEYENKGEFSLTQIYNRGLNDAKYDIVVFLHNDIEIESSSWGNRIVKHFEENPDFGILGLAGTTDIPLTGRWWDDRSKMVGIVNHKSEGKKWESKYSKNWGNEIKEVVIVDGLFFAVHKQRIKTRFDESITGFHFYELDFVFNNYLKGVKVGVMFNVRVTHLSIGITNEQWEVNRAQFVEKYKEQLPLRLIPDFYTPKDSKSIFKTHIKVIIQSSGNVDTFNKLYEKIISFNYPNLQIYLISNDNSYGLFKDLNLDKVKVFEGFYNTLPKNLSVLKFEDNFLTKDDELVFFMNDNVVILNNIFSNFAKIYTEDKNTFGCGFPLSYSNDKTVFSNGLYIFTGKEKQVAIDMKDTGSYYNVHYGLIKNPFGNLSDCFVTTAHHLRSLDWFKLNFETPLYFNEFSLRLFLKHKITFNDTNSLTVQKSFAGQTQIQQDFQSILNFIGTEKKLQEIVKELP